MEQLRKAFGELEPHRDTPWNSNIKLEDIEEYFHELESTLKKKIDKLEVIERKLEEKQAKNQAMISEREVVVAAKEQALLDHLQELKDNAVSVIAESCKKHQGASPKLVDKKGGREDKVSTFANADTKAPISVIEENLPDSKSGESVEQMATKGHLNHTLKQFCEQMDTKGLVKYISEKRKNLATLREELPPALKCAAEPARMVLDALEGFYPPDQPTSHGNENDTALQGLRRSCLLLMESAVPFLTATEPGDHHPLSSEIKQQAKAIADQWKPKMAGIDMDASNGSTLEAQAFLQLLATFCIASEFDEDELCKIIFTVSRRRQTPDLCRSIGLTHKMPGLVETFVSKGRLIDAVHFAHAFQLTESFPPVPLLKAYLDEVTKTVQEIIGDARNAGAQKDAATQELGALRAVIRCIEEYKLQGEFPINPLQKRMAELEKVKAGKKRFSEAAKFQTKKPRGNTGYVPRKPAVTIEYKQPLPPSVYNERGMYYGGSERYTYATPPAFEVPGHVTYGQQASVHRQYQYPHPHERAPASYAAPSNYSGYMGPRAQTTATNQVNYMGAGSEATSSYSGSYPGAGYHQSGSSNYGNYSGAGYQPPHQSYM
ncbi:hypothetical protein J5N97_028574 [Dioscorea zingiberensis]|uniref:FRIGIDA-like protein n=1 Tax=Dioscorea zingiberensis TaxID=325984 RepID=A0A9D5H502_9LILI|nr:hypothetical protein J5N97_028574 [Dioscorea zingiberensis]